MNRNQTFKDRVQEALDASGFGTQKELAHAMDVREATVSGWFNGAWPREDQMRGLVAALGVSGHWLVTGEGPMRPGSDGDTYRLQVIGEIAEGEISPMTLRMIQELRRLESLGATPAQMRKAIRAIRISDAKSGAQS